MSYKTRSRGFDSASNSRPSFSPKLLRLAVARSIMAGLAAGVLSNTLLANRVLADEYDVPEPTRSHAPQLQTVVVTAQKRAEEIQDVPVPITAVTGNAVQEKNITTSADVERLAPNLSGQSSGNTGGRTGKPRWFLRGIGTNDPNANQEGPLAVYVDEVVVVPGRRDGLGPGRPGNPEQIGALEEDHLGRDAGIPGERRYPGLWPGRHRFPFGWL